MTGYLLKELILNDGRIPFEEWFRSLEPTAAVKVTVALARLEQGNFSRVRWFRGIGEVRIDWGAGLRIYLARDSDEIILSLGGGTKHRQQRDIEQAIQRWEDYKSTKRIG